MNSREPETDVPLTDPRREGVDKPAIREGMDTSPRQQADNAPNDAPVIVVSTIITISTRYDRHSAITGASSDNGGL